MDANTIKFDTDLYSDEIYHEGFSVFTGGEKMSGTMKYWELPDTPLMRAFLEDVDIQEIKVASGNIGFVRTYRKSYRKHGKPAC